MQENQNLSEIQQLEQENAQLKQDIAEQRAALQIALEESVAYAFKCLEQNDLAELTEKYEVVQKQIAWQTFLPSEDWALIRSGVGAYYHSQENYKKALSIFEEIFAFIKNKKDISEDVKGTTYLNLLMNYNELGQYQKGINAGLKAIPLLMCNEDNAIDKLALVYKYIDEAYFKLNNYQKSLEYNFSRLQILEKHEIGTATEKGILFVNVSFCYLQLKNYKESMKYIELGMPLLYKNVIENQQSIKETKIDYLNCMRHFFTKMPPLEQGKCRNFVYEYIYDNHNANEIDRFFK